MLKKIKFPIFNILFTISVIFLCVVIIRECNSGGHTRSPISSVKANMHTLQTTVETYAADYKGIYPENIMQLYRDAINKEKNYWKGFYNPFTHEPGITLESVMDFKFYEPIENYKGFVLYDPVGIPPVKYYIYGTDSKGELIKDKGRIFTLTNS